VQKCEDARKQAMEEASRMTRSDGTVIKTMMNGQVQVLDIF